MLWNIVISVSTENDAFVENFEKELRRVLEVAYVEVCFIHAHIHRAGRVCSLRDINGNRIGEVEYRA